MMDSNSVWPYFVIKSVVSFLVLPIPRCSERERERERGGGRGWELVAALVVDSRFFAATVGCWGFVLVLDL